MFNEPKTARGRQTFNSIISAGEELFGKKGYNNTSIVDIVQAANIAQGTFYVHFKDKYSLYKYVLLKHSHEIRKNIAQKTMGLTSRKEVERTGILVYLDYIASHQYAYNIIWESLYIDKDLFKQYYDLFSSRYQQQLKREQDEGRLIDIDIEALCFALMGIATFLGMKYVLFDGVPREKREEIADQALMLLDRNIFVEGNHG